MKAKTCSLVFNRKNKHGQLYLITFLTSILLHFCISVDLRIHQIVMTVNLQLFLAVLYLTPAACQVLSATVKYHLQKIRLSLITTPFCIYFSAYGVIVLEAWYATPV